MWSAVADGTVAGSEELIGQARQATVEALRTCLVSEQTAVLALSAGRAGVEARVLKGVAIAHLDHDNPAERVFGDADILIGRTDYRVALAALTDAGFRRSKPPVRTWWEQRFAKAIVFHALLGAELDLHLTITGGYFGEKIDHDRLWSTSSEPFDLAEVRARGLDREGRLLHACCHAVLGGGSGRRVRRDVAHSRRSAAPTGRLRSHGRDATVSTKCWLRPCERPGGICISTQITSSNSGQRSSLPIRSSIKRSTATTANRSMVGAPRAVARCQHSVGRSGQVSYGLGASVVGKPALSGPHLDPTLEVGSRSTSPLVT